MTTRHEARRIAVDLLYQADVTDADPMEALGEWQERGREVPEFAVELVTGVAAHGGGIDALLEEHAHGWTVARMSAVDRSILRVAAEELRYREDVPDGVAINEAVEIAGELSSDESRRFVNGVLGGIASVPSADDA